MTYYYKHYKLYSMNNELVKIIEFWRKAIKKNLYEREILKRISLKTKEVIDVIGIRRSGKSSILHLIGEQYDLSEKTLYINFEDPFFIEENKPNIIERLISVYEEYFSEDLKLLLFDEVQNIVNWERVIRKLRDTGKYTIIITGSSASLLSREMGSLLTGRHLSYTLYPLSFAEFLNFKGIYIKEKKDIVLMEQKIKKNLELFFETGGFPEVALTGEMTLLKNYFYDILYRDIVVRYNIRDSERLEKIALFLINNSAKLYSLESIKNTYAVSYETAFNYVTYLKQAFFVMELSRFDCSLKSQTRAPKKIYVIDQGLAHSVSFRFSSERGRIMENIVFLELMKREEKLFYFKGKRECDFLIQEKDRIAGVIQVTQELTEKNKKREIHGLTEAMETFQLREGVIITENQEDRFNRGSLKIEVIPLWKWLLNHNH